MSVRKSLLFYLIALCLPCSLVAQGTDAKSREMGLNAINILRGGNNANFIYKIHNPQRKMAKRFGFSGYSNNSSGNLFTQSYDNPVPDQYATYKNTNNSLGFTYGKEFHFYNKENFRVYTFMDVGIGGTISRNTSVTNIDYTTRSNGQRYIYDFEKQARISRSLNVYDNPGIGMRYAWKQFAIFLESNLSVVFSSTYSRTKTTGYSFLSNTQAYQEDYNVATNPPVVNSLNFNFNPYTVLYFSYSW